MTVREDQAGDSVAVVTGGGGGIGSALVRQLRDEGIRVAVVDLTAGPFAASDDSGVLFLECDVTQRAQVEAAFENVLAWGGRVDKLVTCVGGGEYVDSYEVDLAEWQAQMDMNLTGTLHWCQVVGRHMRDNGGGAIVTVGSICATRGFPGRLAYGVAKAAVHQLTRGLAVEWAPDGIRVNCVAPGYVVTPRFEGAVTLDLETLGTMHAVGRTGVAEELASVIRFLLSDAASFVTGEVVFADGGFSAMARPRGYEGTKGITPADVVAARANQAS